MDGPVDGMVEGADLHEVERMDCVLREDEELSREGLDAGLW